MQCDICLRSPSSRLPFNCTACARNALYEPRVQLAQTLLESEAIGKDVESHLVAKPTASKKRVATKSPEVSPTWKLEQTIVEQVAVTERTQDILSHVEALRKETDSMRIEVATRKAKLVQRRSDLKSAADALSQREVVAIDPVEKGVRRMEHRWDAMHTKTAESRVFLCREAAQLYGLQQRKRKRGGPSRDVYLIGGIPIADLRDLNNASPAQVTTSTTNLAHLIHLVSHYLSVRLPAEITLSHRDYPLPTISPPGSSYISREVPFPGFTPPLSSNNSPSASRTADQRSLTRPFPLHLDRKLSALAKEDPAAYALFVEGITFLAWDIAWVCKTQGLNIGANSWEEVCAMGKNLWQLLVAPPPPPHQGPGPTLILGTSSRPPVSRVPTSAVPNAPEDSKAPPSAMLGHFSHGTAHSFLAAAAGTDYMRGWRLQSPVKVVEKVKAMLLSERTGAEWEILEGNEWEEEAGTVTVAGVGGEVGHAGIKDREDEVDRSNIHAKGSSGGGEGRGEGMGNGAAATATATVMGEEDAGRGKGSSGWMKVKSRGGT